MRVTRCEMSDLVAAEKVVIGKYDGNIRLAPDSTPRKFKLIALNNRGPGAVVHTEVHTVRETDPCAIMAGKPALEYIEKKRHLPYACWHAHGDFFEALYRVSDTARIYSLGKPVDRSDVWANTSRMNNCEC